MKRLLLLSLLVAGCAGATDPPTATTAATETLTGTFVLTQDDPVEREVRGGEVTSCGGTGGYSDISDGTQVVVRDGAGTILGTGRLVVDFGDEPIAITRRCLYTFEVAGIPAADFYSVEVADRGELTYSRAELDGLGWHVDTHLGGE